jgi:hypothetical protein
VAVDHRYLFFFHQPRNAFGQLPGDTARALDYFFDVELYVFRAQAERFEVMHQVINFRRAQQCLGRNTAPIQANPAHMRLFHDGRFHAELRRANRRHIPPRPAADNHDVEILFGHFLFS